MNEQPRLPQDRRASARERFLAGWRTIRESEVGPPSDLGICPYPGLRSFRPNESDLFYGRNSQVKELRDLLAAHSIIFVLGGSGSGKSSLVRAGLLPQLNSTSPIPERRGAWYAVEFRPRLRPVTELFDAIVEQIVARVLKVSGAEPGAGRDREAAKERARRIAALNAAFDCECDPDASDDSILQQYSVRIRELLFEGGVIDVGALFDFVDERLRTLDDTLAGGATSGAPNLLLLIDQFEEIFKPDADAQGRKMIMSLITSVHSYKPANLFLIVTMRSEELHRCAEFLGVTEVVNSSMYLIDLIGGRDIEQAIVQPARRVLRSWGLEPGDPETGPYTRRALRLLHQEFDKGRKALPHPADQLPLMQHLLPLIWDKAVERWQDKPDAMPLQIDLEDLEAVPGWNSRDGPLIGTLNAQANEVLRRAISVGAKAGGLDERSVGQMLQVAFCCLAQLDDRGNVVRAFATLDDMLAASGACQRQPERRQQCETALRSALAVFQRATLLNVGPYYDVNHEALIRGWKEYGDKYGGWLGHARRLGDRLVEVDKAVRRKEPELKPRSGLAAWLPRRRDPLERYSKAYQNAGEEAIKDLQQVIGPDSVFSDKWACRELRRGDAASLDPRVGSLRTSDRIDAIRQTVADARDYPEVKDKQARNQLRVLCCSAALAGAAAAILAVYIESQVTLLSETRGANEQFRFFRLQTDATEFPPDWPRPSGKDREVYAALQLGIDSIAKQGDKLKSGTSEAVSVFRAALRELDKGARDVLADGSVVRILEPSTGGEEQSERERVLKSARGAACAIADPTYAGTRTLIGREPDSLGIELKRQDVAGVSIVTMSPIWRAAADRTPEIDQPLSSNLTGQPLPSGSLVCLSPDANWLLTWPSQPDAQHVSPPIIQRIQWIRTGPKAARDGRWHVRLSQQRRPTTSLSWYSVGLLSKEYRALHRAVGNGRQDAFKWFQDGERVGFLIEMAQGGTAMLQTMTGLKDPIPVDTELPHALEACVFKRSSGFGEWDEEQALMRCEMGPIEFDGLSHRLLAVRTAVESAPSPQAPPDNAQQDEEESTRGGIVLAGTSFQMLQSCAPESDPCWVELRIEYDPPHAERDAVRASFPHLSSTIKAAAIWDDSLWVRDANGQVWRYLVGLKAIQAGLPHRWAGIPDTYLSKVLPSEACRLAGCDKIKVPGWPDRQ